MKKRPTRLGSKGWGRKESMEWMFKHHGLPVAPGDVFLDAARAYFSKTQHAGGDEKGPGPHGSEYALTVVTEYADMEVTVCRGCHGWGCWPGPCRDIPIHLDDK